MKGRERAWNDAERRRVKAMLRAGKSMRGIGQLLGLTRNMVIGRVNRDGELHSFVAKVVLPVVTPLKAKHHHALPDPLPLPDAVEPKAEPGQLLYDLRRDDCRWPVEAADVVGGHLFCGRPRLGDWTPYCRKHDALAHPGGRHG